MYHNKYYIKRKETWLKKKWNILSFNRNKKVSANTQINV